MTVSVNNMSEQVLAAYRASMKTLNPKAIPTDQQEVLITALCQGLVKVLLATKLTSILPFGNATGIPGKGFIVVPSIMTQAALTSMQGLVGGSGGPALQPAFDSIMTAIAAYFATNVSVVPITGGFGGQPLPPITMTASLIQAAIVAALPTTWQTNMAKSKHGMDFIKSFAVGMSAGCVAGVVGVIPAASPPPSGPLIASFM